MVSLPRVRFVQFLRAFILFGALVTGTFVLSPAALAAGGPGTWAEAQVNTAISNGVAYLDSQQLSNGSYGGGSVAETGMALAAYGVLANGSFASLTSTYQAHVKNAIAFLLSTQDTTSAPGPNSSFGEITNKGYPTYETGIALLGLSYFQNVNPGIVAAIADAREFLVNEFEGPTNDGCSASDSAVATTASWCGGWNYDPDDSRSDESNSGYAMTGLEVTGGIPIVSQSDGTTLIQDNVGWNHHIQVISTNPFTLTANAGTGGDDGGGSYQPGDARTHPNEFASNANDSGTMLFSYADDGVAVSDPNVAAAIRFDQDALNSYELEQANVGPASMQMIYHAGATEDGSCTPNVGTCDWFNDGDGGYHYSLFALAKGLGDYIPSDLAGPTNWYAQVVDLLLSQQGSDGSWPTNGRDDYNTVFATGLAVATLGKAGVIPSTTKLTTSLTGGGQSGTSVSLASGTAVTDTATLTGTSATMATGTVTYDVYSNSTCTSLAFKGTAQSITTPGTLPPSPPVTLSIPGTFYWQASYSGDSNNSPSASACTGEVETVTGASTKLQLYISAPYQDNGVTVVSLWWTAPPGATSFILTANESTGIGPYSYTATGLAQYGPSNPFIVQVEGATTLNTATFQVTDNEGDNSNIVNYP